MSRPKLKRPSPGTALGLLALIVALAGTANAKPDRVVVRKGDIAKGAVTAKALAAGAVNSRALAKNSIKPKALRSGAVTARALAAGSVTSRAIQPGSVGNSALEQGAVTSASLAPNAVTGRALAPGSVYGGALGPVATYTKEIEDLDEAPDNSIWTPSNRETVDCGPGEHLLTGGVHLTDSGNGEVGIIESTPFSDQFGDGFFGRITSNSGGSATAQVTAICLK